MKPNLTYNYSPNFSTRKRNPKNIKFVVIHYTGMKSEIEAIKRLSDVNSKVSCHYFVKKSGDLILMVPENYIAWHAGESSYKGVNNCNDYSIGIELEGSDDDIYSDLQYEMLIKITNEIINEYPLLDKKSIIGHSDVSPGRKVDPGSKFDWNRFLEAL